MKFPIVRRGVLLAAPIGSQDVFTLMFPQMADPHNNRTGSPLHRPGSKLETGKLFRKVVVKPQTSPKRLPRGSRSINDNYCVLNVAGVKNSVHVSSKRKDLNPSPVTSKSETVVIHVNSFFTNVHSVTGLPQKKGVNPNYGCSRTGSKPKLTGVLQPAIFGTQTQQLVETHPGPELSEHLPKQRVVQNGDPKDNKDLPSDRGVGHFHRLQGCILPHTNSQSVQEVHVFSHPGSVLPVQSPTLWSVHSTYRVHSGGQRGQTDGLTEGYKIHQYLDGWLVRATSHQTCLQHTQTLVALCRELGWLVNEKSELDPKQVFIFVGYQFDLREGKVRPTPELWQTLTDKILSILSGVSSPTVYVPYRTSDSHRKTSPPRLTSHETHTVAQLEGNRITRKGDTHSQVAPPSLKVVAGGKQCSSKSTITPTKTCSADIYRRIKRRMGRSLK